MTIAPGLGARIIGCRIDDRNVLLEADAVAGTDNANNFGATFWPSPQSAWGWPPIAEIDHGPYTVKPIEGGVVLESGIAELPDGARISLTKTITALPQIAAFDIEYVISNTGNRPVFLAGWQIARVRAGGLTFFRLGEGGVSGDKLQTVTRNGVQWYEYDPAIVVAQGQKTFADGKGWLAHVDRDLLLVQAFPDVPAGGAATGEAEVELYSDPTHTYVEIEPQSRVEAIAAGSQSSPWKVRWWLCQLPAAMPCEAYSPDLVEMVESLIAS